MNFVVCHDDIVLANGPACNPGLETQHIFRRDEEYWDILEQGGKEMLFMIDGCVAAFVDGKRGFCKKRSRCSRPIDPHW